MPIPLIFLGSTSSRATSSILERAEVGPHFHYRVQCDQNIAAGRYGGDRYATINEIIYKDESGTDLTVVHGGTASQLSTFSEGWAAKMAFDRSSRNSSSSGERDEARQWIDFKFTSPQEPTRVTLKTSRKYSERNEMVRDFRIQYSDDGTDFTTILTVKNEPSWSTNEERTYIF